MNPSIHVLVVDDDPTHAESTGEILEKSGYRVSIATSGTSGKELISSSAPDIVITDLVMSEVDGFEILKHARNTIEDVQVIMMTGHGSVKTAVQAMEQGAFTYLTKPINIDETRAVVARATERIVLTRDNRNMHLQLDEKFGFEGLISNSSKMNKVFSILKQVAPTDASVLITGESGTGKELIAKSLHNNSKRKNKLFVPLNCAALNEGILESELFGHAKGAFTGAVSNRQGKFEYANGGTLFLDEVGDIPLGTQVKLLRTLENGEISVVGSNVTKIVDVRIIAATNQNLEDLIRKGRFREDLYFRLKVIQLHLPPLRDRKQDIPLLLDHFIKEMSDKYNKMISGISQPARQILYQHDWPGNVRELRNAVESMVVVCTASLIGLEHLPEPLSTSSHSGDHDIEIAPGTTMAEMEKRLIIETLKMVGDNRHEAARILDIGERTLYRKLKSYDHK